MRSNDDSPPGNRLRALRLGLGLTQQQLAERAELSLGVVKKIERGGTARLETYHTLARTLGVRTSQLLDTSAPHRDQRDDDSDNHALLALRQVIAPPMTATGSLGLTDDPEAEPDLRAMWQAADLLADTYYRDDYGTVAQQLPALVRSAHLAVRHFDTGAEQTEALRLRACVLQMVGRYLVQVRAYDLAQMALRDAVQDAVRADDQGGVAAAVYQQGWSLIRQGRLDEAEAVSVATADVTEPRLSRASRASLGAWGKLLVHGSSAAARNNRPHEAREMLRLARAAGIALGGQQAVSQATWGRFDWRTVAYQAIENHMTADNPGRALALAAKMPPPPRNATFGRRHLLTVAQAHAARRSGDKALAILLDLSRTSPEWLRHQRLAADVFREVRDKRSRAMSRDHRELAVLLGVL
ncbi:helix-turn-helix domain-containing protein [Streptomyces avicenniae]|uniref:helix-turn-helix domain-containing protein n=1 Tax=Streptomyces avicenniae TaxID=500153 RepID=UPI00069C2968|nr:helix-turn-helix transcriptional regulator [Streptomyces avicenniae]